jgi:hypothetical protein
VNPPKTTSCLRTSLLLLSLACSLGFGVVACTVEPDVNANSGPDHQKAGARELQFSRSSTDSVDRKSGDMTDWKYFRVPATGLIEFSISFDNPDSRGVAIVRDALGLQLARLEHRGQPILKATFRGEPGIYYLEIFSQVGHTVYTYDVNFQPLY